MEKGNLEIFKSSYGYYNFRISDGKPSEELVNYLKESGYRWSRNKNCWYPATSEAKEANLHGDFVADLQERFFSVQELRASGERGDEADKALQNDERTVQLEALIAELRELRRLDLEKIARLESELTQQRESAEEADRAAEQALLDDEAEWERENTLTDEEEAELISKNENHENTGELELSPKELSVAKSVLPSAQYVTTLRLSHGAEGNFFKQKIKDIAKAVENAPKIGETDGMEQHPIVLRYFHPTGGETLVCEIGENGEAFGFQCLNGDYEMAEWGNIDLNEIKNIPGMEMDYHVEEGMTVERWLYQERPAMYPQYAKFAENKTEGQKSSDITFALYQVKESADDVTSEEEIRAVQYVGYKELKHSHHDVKRERYNKVYESTLSKFGIKGNIDDKEVAEMIAERIFNDFNTKIPDDFHGHSLSVSDVIVMEQNGRKIPFFVDGFGFVSDAIGLEQFIEDDIELSQKLENERNSSEPVKISPVTLDWERVGTRDEFINRDFALSGGRTDDTSALSRVARRINDTNNWNDDFIPVVFANAESEVTGVKLYDKDFFNNPAQRIRNEFQFSGIEAGAVRAFPVVTEALSQKVGEVGMMLLEGRMKELVRQNAFTDAALPASTVVEKYGMKSGIPLFDTHGAGAKNPEVQATWETRINPDLFPQERTARQTEPLQIQQKPPLKKAVGMEY